MKPIVLAWRVTCHSCGRLLAETSSYQSANGVWAQHKIAHLSSARTDQAPRPQIELIRLE